MLHKRAIVLPAIKFLLTRIGPSQQTNEWQSANSLETDQSRPSKCLCKYIEISFSRFTSLEQHSNHRIIMQGASQYDMQPAPKVALQIFSPLLHAATSQLHRCSLILKSLESVCGLLVNEDFGDDAACARAATKVAER